MKSAVQKRKLLIIEDDEAIRDQIKWALSEDYALTFAHDGHSAVEALRQESPAVVTLDLGLPPSPDDTCEGLDLLARILEAAPLTKVIVVTGNSERPQALKAISMGAHDFFAKPFDVEELKAVISRAHYVYLLEEENRQARTKLSSQPFEEIVGTCQKMQEVFSAVRKVAATDVPILITGESGTGKELIVRAVHGSSLRRAKPFVAINCGAIPDNLLESELFGHEKGSFTGAHASKPGKIELAAGGTLFLDEVAEMPLHLQVKMLRFLQNHKIERVGAREAVDVDLRVVAATNRDVKKLVVEGRFREDLYYRLAVVTIELPPLRERGDDMLVLVRAFLQKFSEAGAAPRYLSLESLEAIKSYEWPGNVRELENRIQRAVTFCEGPVIKPADMGFGAVEAQQLDLKKAKENLEQKFASMAITKHRGNISKAASELGLSRPTLHHLIKKYNIMK